MKNEEKVFVILVLMIALVMVFLGFEFRGGSKILPLISGISSAFLLGFLLFMSFSFRAYGWYQKLETKPVFSEKQARIRERRREISVLGWFSGCTALIYLAGFTIGIPVFLFLFLKVWAKESYLLSIVLSGIVLGVVYFAFIHVLRVPLHKGILFAY
ncbi:MAG: tripartite tricarboxylate transporter TctB family protein [Deltaproteobacteria bacterium]|nr:tripartite tricarboxylate transporter TctB family protein [Deltaproteobacteria bacterium]